MGKKLTDRQKLERKAARITEKDRKAAGLFADYVEPTTADDVYWKMRRDKARAVEGHNPGRAPEVGMEWLRLHAIERLATRLLGECVAAPVIEYVRRTYPMPDYGHSVWSDLLTGQSRVVLKMRAEPDPRPGSPNRMRVAEELAFPPAGWSPPLTKNQFWELFPYKEPVLGADDPAGLFERTIGALGRAA